MGAFFIRSSFKTSEFNNEQTFADDIPHESANDSDLSVQQSAPRRWHYQHVIDSQDDLPYVTIRPKTKNKTNAKRLLRMRPNWD
jgi:hypothetical protein